jgi:hypothetical protein
MAERKASQGDGEEVDFEAVQECKAAKQRRATLISDINELLTDLRFELEELC